MPLALTRAQILGHRRRVNLLDARASRTAASLRQAAWAGCTDSMPRAAVLSLHARLDGVTPDAWEDPALAQVWGPRFSAYVVAEEDVAVFTRGRLAASGAKRQRADELARSLADHLGGERGDVRDAGRAVGVHHNAFRHAAATGTVRIRWDGARQPDVWTVPEPDVDDDEMRRELPRRHLHVAGPSTVESYANWAGLNLTAARAAFVSLADELVEVGTPIGDALILAEDEPSFRAGPDAPAPARLLPSGDAYWMCWGSDRELLVADAEPRDELWTPRVWPGAVMVEGEIVGTWRRSRHEVTIHPWQHLSHAQRAVVEAEATSFPLPDLDRDIDVTWGQGPSGR